MIPKPRSISSCRLADHARLKLSRFSNRKLSGAGEMRSYVSCTGAQSRTRDRRRRLRKWGAETPLTNPQASYLRSAVQILK
jgi:hypothetical protein